MSISVCTCSCPRQSSIEDLLRCAPCPPPMISYLAFRDHALHRRLSLKEVCRIAIKCNINDTNVATDCPPETQEDELLSQMLLILISMLGLTLIVSVLFCFRLVKRILKRYDVSVSKYVLNTDIEVVMSERHSERLNRERNSGRETFTETLFNEKVPTHFYECVIHTEENMIQTHNLEEEILDEQFYTAEEVMTIERVQLGKGDKSHSGENEIGLTLHQHDATEMFEDKSVQENITLMDWQYIETSDQIISETSAPKMLDNSMQNPHENMIEDDDDSESYYSLNEDEDNLLILT